MTTGQVWPSGGGSGGVDPEALNEAIDDRLGALEVRAYPPYTTVAADIDDDDAVLTVDEAAADAYPSEVPFDVLIGTEVLRVTSIVSPDEIKMAAEVDEAAPDSGIQPEDGLATHFKFHQSSGASTTINGIQLLIPGQPDAGTIRVGIADLISGGSYGDEVWVKLDDGTTDAYVDTDADDIEPSDTEWQTFLFPDELTLTNNYAKMLLVRHLTVGNWIGIGQGNGDGPPNIGLGAFNVGNHDNVNKINIAADSDQPSLGHYTGAPPGGPFSHYFYWVGQPWRGDTRRFPQFRLITHSVTGVTTWNVSRHRRGTDAADHLEGAQVSYVPDAGTVP